MLYPFFFGGGGKKFLTSLTFATSLFGSPGENNSLPPPPSTASLEIKGLILLFGLRASIQTQKVDLKNALLIRFTP